MLLKILKAQGMKVIWHEQLPSGAQEAAKTNNEAGAAWIKSVHRRPGVRLKMLRERPEVAAPPRAATRQHERERKVLARKKAPRREHRPRKKRGFTKYGNKLTEPCQVAVAQVRIARAGPPARRPTATHRATPVPPHHSAIASSTSSRRTRAASAASSSPTPRASPRRPASAPRTPSCARRAARCRR